MEPTHTTLSAKYYNQQICPWTKNAAMIPKLQDTLQEWLIYDVIQLITSYAIQPMILIPAFNTKQNCCVLCYDVSTKRWVKQVVNLNQKECETLTYFFPYYGTFEHIQGVDLSDLNFQRLKCPSEIFKGSQIFGTIKMDNTIYIDHAWGFACFNVITKSWTKLTRPKFHLTMEYLSYVTHQKYNVIFCVGNNAEPSLQEYNPITNTWTDKAPMTWCRRNVATVLVDDIIYAFGGGDDVSKNNYTSSYCEFYDIKIDKWTRIENMIKPMASAFCVFVDDHIIVIGSTKEDGLWNYYVQMYHIKTQEWLVPTRITSNDWFDCYPRSLFRSGFVTY